MISAVDLFAGAGGFTLGATMAGYRVRWAANHWPLAVAAHAANHRETEHVCQDLHQANFNNVPDHDVGLCSPSCQGQSRARGKDRPHHDACRATAWVVPAYAEAKRPKGIVVENVPEFLNWELFPAWRDAMAILGYRFAPHILDAADFGIPQHRVRLFLIAIRNAEPIQLTFAPRPHRPASSIIHDDGRWSAVRSKCQNTRHRIAAGRREFGSQFLIPYYSSGSGLTGRSLDRPIGTITTRARWAVVNGTKMRMLSLAESKAAMGFPQDYVLHRTTTHSLTMLGNAVVPKIACEILTRLKAIL